MHTITKNLQYAKADGLGTILVGEKDREQHDNILNVYVVMKRPEGQCLWHHILISLSYL